MAQICACTPPTCVGAVGLGVQQHVRHVAVDEIDELVDHAGLELLHAHARQELLQPHHQLRELRRRGAALLLLLLLLAAAASTACRC